MTCREIRERFEHRSSAAPWTDPQAFLPYGPIPFRPEALQMTDETLAQQLAALRSLLAEVDDRLGRTPAAPEGLEDLKRSVDTLRTNMWAILSAGRGVATAGRIERFRLRRAIDGVRGISNDIASGASTTLHPEHAELQLLARELMDQIGRLR